MSNTLVAGVQDGTKGWTGTGVADNAIESYQAIARGDWGEGLTQGAVGALGALGAVADPLAAVASAGVGWALEHCGPLRDALDSLAGDPGRIESFAATWGNVSQELTGAADQFAADVKADTAQWNSTAIDAYRMLATAQAHMITAIGTASAAIGEAVGLGGVVVATVRSTVRDLIAEAVGQIVSKALQAATVVLIPKVAVEVIALVAKWSLRIAGWLKRVVAIMTKLSALCKKLAPIFKQAEDWNRAVLTRYDDTLKNGMYGGKPLNGYKDPALPGGGTVPVEQYPRVTAANNTLTETGKGVQEDEPERKP